MIAEKHKDYSGIKIIIPAMVGALIIGGIIYLSITKVNTPGGKIRTNIDSETIQPEPNPNPLIDPDGENFGQDSNQTNIPDLVLENYVAEGVNLLSYKGKPLVLNTYASWCPFCVAELPNFIKVQQEFQDQVVIIAINRAESKTVAKKFTDGMGISNDLVFLLDDSDSFWRAIGGFSMPETIFINSDGTEQFHKRGPMGVSEIRQRVSNLITKSQ